MCRHLRQEARGRSGPLGRNCGLTRERARQELTKEIGRDRQDGAKTALDS